MALAEGWSGWEARLGAGQLSEAEKPAPIQPETCARGMVDLSAESGLPLWLDLEHDRLVLMQPAQQLEAGNWLPGMQASAGANYWLFPDVALPTDVGVFAEYGVRHNLLLIPPREPGGEYTRVDAHALALPDGARCGEAYGVVYGQVIFLLQQQPLGPGPVPVGPAASVVRWLAAQTGDKILVPPETDGLAIVNTGEQPLVLSNLAASAALPVAQPYEGSEDAYQVCEHQGRPRVQADERYRGPRPAIYHSTPTSAPALGLVEDVPLYSAFVHDPEQFHWLVVGAPAVTGVS